MVNLSDLYIEKDYLAFKNNIHYHSVYPIFGGPIG